jgi:energy-coupling factor transporter ATP-binding protein EcfA2
MKHYLLVGRTGVGKSSFVNSAFGITVAKTSPYEACTKLVEYHAHKTQFGDVCLIDTPGLGERDDELDDAYLRRIWSRIADITLHAVIFVSPLNETRFRPEERRALSAITSHLGAAIWDSAWLVFTFASSVPANKRLAAATQRAWHIIEYLKSETVASPLGGFTDFGNILLIDNVVPNWCRDGVPIKSLL